MEYKIGDRVRITSVKPWISDKDMYVGHEFIISRIDDRCDASCTYDKRDMCDKTSSNQCILVKSVDKKRKKCTSIWTCHCTIEKIADDSIVVNHSNSVSIVKILDEIKEMSVKGYMLDHYEVLGNDESINLEYRLTN